MFEANLFEDRFYEKKIEIGDYGEEKIIPSFKKVEFCRWACTEGKTSDNFKNFSSIIEIFESILEKEAA